MMRLKLAVVVLGTGALGGAFPAVAHHSFAAEFDADSPIDLTGTVTKVEWMNPHTFFYIDVQSEQGAYENWALEMGSPNGLSRRGWTRNTLQIGDVVTVTGSRAKDGSFKGNVRTIVRSSGEVLWGAAPEADEAPESN
jgi:hypothetical protein